VVKKALIAGLALAVSGCATSPDKIQAAHVSPLKYKDYDCEQLALETASVERRVGELHGNLDKKAGADAAQMGVGLVLFWPALFFLEGGDGPEAQEYARLKGEYQALEDVTIAKKCATQKRTGTDTAL
jgi:hypothetical protein